MRQKVMNVSADGMDRPDFRRKLPESRQCMDCCGRNTAPGIKNRAQTEQAFPNPQTDGERR